MIANKLLRYLFTLALVVLAAALRIWPLQSLGSGLAWLTFHPCVVLAAIYGGLAAGLLATALACLTVKFCWPLLVAQPFISKPGDWLGMAIFALLGVMISVVVDAMHRANLRARQALEQAEAARQQLSQLSLAVEQSPESIVITDLDAVIQYVNTAFVNNTGYSRADAVGRNPRILQSGKTPPETFAAMWDALLGGRAWQGELYNRRKDGSEYIESVIITPLCQPDGRISHYVAVKEDITGHKQKEAELRRAMEMAESASRAKSRFLASMSHEIRTPMNGILGMARMLQTPALPDAERSDYAHTILSCGESLLALLNDILDLTKVEAGKFELESTVLDPGQIIHEIQMLFTESVNQKGLRLETCWNGPVGQRYRGDPHRLHQMLSNLASNAVKFTAQGYLLIEARELERGEAGAILEFSVSDTGIGIAPDKLALLFNPFSQVDSSTTRQYGGTGLGLSIVRRLARLMGGDVGVESRVGQGSRFWFRIRLGVLAEGEGHGLCAAPPQAPEEILKPDVWKKLKGKILLVEDNPTNLKVIKAMLRRTELQCHVAEDGLQAVDAIGGGLNPDLVLMDCQMPVMDGFEATQIIRRRELELALPRLTIVALTAGVYEVDRERCLEAGMDDFLEKPINVEKLLATLAHWLLIQPDEADPLATETVVARDEGNPVFSESMLLGHLGGDHELAATIIRSALTDIPGYFDELELAMAAGNGKDARRKTHTLKSLTAQIGGVVLSRHLTEIDQMLKEGGEPDFEIVTDLRREYLALTEALRTWR